MKLIKIFGIVAGLHAFALLLIFANPGCSSTTRQAAAAPASAPPPADPPPVISAPPPIAAVPVVPAPPPAADTAPEAAPSANGGAFYSPTRPGTPAAAALESQPVSDVTPAAAYTVGRGDSLWSIAKKNHLRVSALAAANHLRVGTTLRPGQRLIIPGKPVEGRGGRAKASSAAEGTRESAPAASSGTGQPLKHRVRPGETLGSIARHYGVHLGELATANNISDPKMIRPGQELIIPSGGRARGGRSAGPSANPPPPPAAPSVPSANQDLDSGLKPAPQNSEVPVIRIDPDANSANPPAKQP